MIFDADILQHGSTALVRCSRIISAHVIANLLPSLPVKNLENIHHAAKLDVRV